MASFAGGAIEAFVGPADLGADDDLEQEIIRFIEGAQSRLDIAVQELDSMPIAQALLDARWNGVTIRLVLEQTYLEDEGDFLTKTMKEAPAEGEETAEQARQRIQWHDDPPSGLAMNREIFSALLRSNVHIWIDNNPAIFHQKFAIRDFQGSKKETSALLTGSANWTHTDCHTNLNHLVVFHDHRVCDEYLNEFAEIASGSFGRQRHGDVPKSINIGGIPVRVLFAPDHTPELEVIKQMLRAKDRVDFAIFTFSGSSGIDDAMVMLTRADVAVRGALDPAQGRQWWAATEWLHDEGIEVFFPRPKAGFRKLHHKLMVIDDAIVVAGSFNYTAPANEYNDENIFVLGSPFELPDDEGGPVDSQACADITAFFRDEIDRIVSESSPYIPPDQ